MSWGPSGEEQGSLTHLHSGEVAAAEAKSVASVARDTRAVVEIFIVCFELGGMSPSCKRVW